MCGETRMKIGIITVFNAENCGSFLQAWALNEQLSAMGNDVFFCRYKRPKNANKAITIAKCLLRLKFKRANNILKKHFDFKRARKDFTIKNPGNDTELYFFGSDTLWNFQDIFFKEQYEFFTGANIKEPCYTFSIAVGSTSKEEFVENTEAVKNIQKFKKIAVRDEHTKNVVSEIYSAEKIYKTVDPTLLIDRKTYLKTFCCEGVVPQNSLVVYYFGIIPETVLKELKRFSKENGLIIVNVGPHEKVFDKNVVASPSNFISAFSNAKYIFTNTFHGCVFSTIFNKQFVTDGCHKKKVRNFLEEFMLFDRCISCTEDIEKVFTKSVDYDKINMLINEKSIESMNYLRMAVEEVKDNE